MGKIKRCTYCGREFLAAHASRGFCSVECRRAHINKKSNENYHRNHKPPQARNCIVCGKEFQPSTYHQTICSVECKRERRHYHDAAFSQRKRAGLAQKKPPRDKNHLDYLAHLEKAYGYPDGGTIRQTINSWYERRSTNGN